MILVTDGAASRRKLNSVLQQIIRRYDTGTEIFVEISRDFDRQIGFRDLYVSVTDSGGREFASPVIDLVIKCRMNFFLLSYPEGYQKKEDFLPADSIVFYFPLHRAKDGLRVVVGK